MSAPHRKIYLIASQKGGVGKSTIAAALGQTLANRRGHKVIVCDLDTGQHTQRALAELRGETVSQLFPRAYDWVCITNINQLASATEGYTDVILDGAPHASRDTLRLAESSDLIILPTGPCALDLGPTANLARDLMAGGIPQDRIRMVIVRAGSLADAQQARLTLIENGFHVVGEDLRFSTGYSKAADQGKTVLEARHPALRERAHAVIAGVLR